MPTILLSTNAALAALTWESLSSDHHPQITDAAVASEYKFTNSGETPVTITGINTSCECTSAALEKTVYAPGESGAIKVNFTLGDRVGKVHKTISVKTDDPSQPLVILSMDVEIPKLWTISRRFVQWNPEL